MIPAFLAAIAVGVCAMVAEVLMEGLLKVLLGGIGVATVWLLTFGRIRLKFMDDAQSETVGLVVVLAVCSLCLMV